MTIEIKDHHRSIAKLLNNGGFVSRMELTDLPAVMELTKNCYHFEVNMFEDEEGNWISVRSYEE